MRITLILVFIIFVASCATQPRGQVFERGMASWYGAQFQNHKTASGEVFDLRKMTAAHPTLPMGSSVRVHCVRSAKEVVVRINDRGPFSKGRVIDLSREAARRLGMIEKGEEEVELYLVP